MKHQILDSPTKDIERQKRWLKLLDDSNKKGRKLGINSEEQVYRIIDNVSKNEPEIAEKKNHRY